jgi:hypothetical protein
MIDPTTVEKAFGIKVTKPINVKNNEIINLDDKTPNEQMQALYDDLNNIKYISKPSIGMCRYVVSQNPMLFKYCKNNTMALCNAAVERCPENLEFAFNTSRDVIIKVLSKDGLLLKYVRNSAWHPGIRETAITQNGLALQYIPFDDRKFDLCRLAVLQNEDAIQYVPDGIKNTDKFKIKLTKNYPHYMKDIDNNIQNLIAVVKVNPAVVFMFNDLTKDIITKMIDANYKVCNYLVLSEDLRKRCLQKSPMAVKYLPSPTPAEIQFAVYIYPEAIQHIPFNIDTAIAAVNRKGTVLEYVKKSDQTIKLVAAAIKQNAAAVEFANNIYLTDDVLQDVARRYPKIVVLMKDFGHMGCDREAIYATALAVNGHMLAHIDNPSEYLQKIAVAQTPDAIAYVQEPSLELQLIAINQDPLSIQHIHGQSLEACKRAVAADARCIEYVSREVWDDIIYLLKYDK